MNIADDGEAFSAHQSIDTRSDDLPSKQPMFCATRSQRLQAG